MPGSTGIMEYWNNGFDGSRPIFKGLAETKK
jgi:hypothetical protein